MADLTFTGRSTPEHSDTEHPDTEHSSTEQSTPVDLDGGNLDQHQLDALLTQAAEVLDAVAGGVGAAHVALGLYVRSEPGTWTRSLGSPEMLPEEVAHRPELDAIPQSPVLGSESLALLRLSEHRLLVAAAPRLKEGPLWDSTARRVLAAVGRNLASDLRRAAQLQQLQATQGELEGRSRALEAFAALTRELTLQADDVTLIRRAQQVALSLLPRGTALYYRLGDGRLNADQLSGGLWRLISQVGDSMQTPALQAVINAGLPYATTHNLRVPWESGLPYYQDRYDQGTDNLPELTQAVGATACLPVFMAGKPAGIFAVALAESRHWTAADRAILEAVTRSLSLAKEGARSVTALRDRSAELERSNRELEQFAYVASHDLQEPLRTVTSFAQLLVGRYRGQLDPKADVYLGMISDGTGRMSRLLQDLLAFSRVATSVQPLVALDMNVLLAEVCQDLQAQVQRTGAVVSISTLPTVTGEASQLRQVFQNLIGNALKFSVPGRAVEVSVEAVPDEHIAGMVRFAVRDNGIGIAPAFHARIFTIFQRLHNREQFEGSGMGLSIARKIVERHGGEIWLESVEGQGSTFFLTLPTAQVTE